MTESLDHDAYTSLYSAFFDTGSQRSFVSPKIVRRVKLPVVEQVPIQLSTFGNNSMSCLLDLVRVRPLSHGTGDALVRAYIEGTPM